MSSSSLSTCYTSSESGSTSDYLVQHPQRMLKLYKTYSKRISIIESNMKKLNRKMETSLGSRYKKRVFYNGRNIYTDIPYNPTLAYNKKVTSALWSAIKHAEPRVTMTYETFCLGVALQGDPEVTAATIYSAGRAHSAHRHRTDFCDGCC
jgi:phage baseplate assembly protein W